MYNPIKLILTALLMSLLFGCSEQNPHKVLIVDLSIVAKELGRDSMINAKLNEANKVLQQRLLTIKENIEEKVVAEKDKITGTDTNEQAALQALVIKAKQTMQLAQSKAKERSKQYQEQLLQQFKDEIIPIVASIAKQQNASMVRLHNASLLWVDNAVDITEQVITELRKKSPQVHEAGVSTTE